MNKVVERLALPMRVVSAFRGSADRANLEYISENRDTETYVVLFIASEVSYLLILYLVF